MSITKNNEIKPKMDEFVDSEGGIIGGDRNATSDSEIETGPVDKPFNDYSDYEKGVSTNDVLSTFQLNNKNLVVITENIKEISEKINNSDGMISRLINDKNIFNDLQRSILNIEHVTSKTLSAANNLNSFTYKLDTSNGLL